MKQKRGQITLFIIIGIVVLFGVFGVLYVNQQIKKQNQPAVTEVEKIPTGLEPVRKVVQDCMQSVGESSIDLLSAQGGHIAPDSYAANWQNKDILYYFYKEMDLTPSERYLENELSNYMDARLPLCTNNFQSFQEQGYTIAPGKINTTAIIGLRQVTFSVDWPIRVNDAQIRKFSANINSPLGLLYGISKQVIDLQKLAPDEVCTSCLNQLGQKMNVTFNLLWNLNETLIFEITDLGSNKTFVFANAYKT